MEIVGVDAAGIYSVGYQIGLVIGLIQNSFNQAWVPWFYKKMFDGDFEDRINIVRITYLYSIVMFILVGVLTISVPLIFSFLGRDFAGASKFVLWIGVGFAFNGMYKMVVNYLLFLKMTHLIGGITLLTAVINVILNYFLIGTFGAIGAAYGTALALFIQFILTLIVSIKSYKMPWLMNFRN
jgi:O-antigen/teichoic acid export membrane protein